MLYDSVLEHISTSGESVE